ncbi:MAG: hypothetical protein KA957_03525 [Syntrophaceae bacterium]|nr:hypothetical protein [Syntrophaceae bacterium]
MEAIIGGLIGGIFRVIPELIKLFDAKSERKHELDMQDKAIEFQKLTGSQKLNEITAQGQVEWDKRALDALKGAIEGQDKPSGVAWIDGLSKLMRPVITLQWVIILYPAVIVSQIILLVVSGTPAPEAVIRIFGAEEKAITAGILNFWFLGRVFDHVRR